jgi:hypothetical protein
MNTSVFFPLQLHWTAQQIADAVPLRLHEMFAFDANYDDPAAAANTATSGFRSQRDYLHMSGLPARFRIR